MSNRDKNDATIYQAKQKNDTIIDNDKKLLREPKRLPGKKFLLRQSLLTELCETDPNIKTVYNLFVLSFVYLFIDSVLQDYVKYGEIKSGFRHIYFHFAEPHILLYCWLGYHLLSCLGYICFNLWATIRTNLLRKSVATKIWDHFWVSMLVVYYVSSFYLVPFLLKTFQIPPAAAVFLILEKARFVMKLHAFVRSNASKVLEHEGHGNKKVKLPAFSDYLYFHFAPTLVYSSNYPRTGKIRWNFIMYRTMELVASTLYFSFLIEKGQPAFQQFGVRKFSWAEISMITFEQSINGFLIVVTANFLILHSIQNIFAELLHFGDRMFYEDWWTSSSYSEYFRKWNTIVSDWMYMYIYKDMYEVVMPGDKTVAKLSVFLLSIFAHEWGITCALGHFVPLNALYFFLGFLMSLKKMPKSGIMNILLLFLLAFGAGNILSFHCLDYYALKNVPVTNSTLKGYLLPWWLQCNSIG